jgi:hypothetical protein
MEGMNHHALAANSIGRAKKQIPTQAHLNRSFDPWFNLKNRIVIFFAAFC